MRYVFGPSVEYAKPDPVPPTPRPDAIVAIADLTESQVTLSITSPGSDFNYPAELRVYLIGQGLEMPADVEGYVVSELPVAIYHPTEFDAAPATITLPEVLPGAYVLQTVVGYVE